MKKILSQLFKLSVRKLLIAITALGIMPVALHAQLPTNVIFPNYQLNTPVPFQVSTAPTGWVLYDGSPDIDDMDFLFREEPVYSWNFKPATLFPAGVSSIIIGCYSPFKGATAESFRQAISGLVPGMSYTYSFIVTGNNIPDGGNATEIPIGIFRNRILLASQTIPIGTIASRKYFTFIAPSTAFNFVVGIINDNVINGVNETGPWYNIAGGSGEFVLTSTLPVTLTSFNAQSLDATCAVKISWTAGQEINIKNYEIERSKDGRSWISIFTRQSRAGGNGNNLAYDYTDLNPLEGKSYYRLTSKDFDGKVQFSNILVVKLNCDKPLKEIIVYPNPTKDKITITGLKAGMQLKIFNNIGQLMLASIINSPVQTFPVSKYIVGEYFIKVWNEKGELQSQSRFVKE